MLEGKITALDQHRNTGEVEIDGTGWRVPADIPNGLVVGDRVEFLLQTHDVNWFDRQQRAVDVRRA
jgi:hypothetical protein